MSCFEFYIRIIVCVLAVAMHDTAKIKHGMAWPICDSQMRYLRAIYSQPFGLLRLRFRIGPKSRNGLVMKNACQAVHT